VKHLLKAFNVLETDKIGVENSVENYSIVRKKNFIQNG
jgi:hypothetical protein